MIKNETPSQSEVIRQAIEDRLAEVHVALPGEVISYEASNQKATIQPVLKRKFKGQDPIDLPPIADVPVKWMRTQDAIISLPLKSGDTGTLLFHERSLDIWLAKGGRVSPDDPRKHSLSDAEFLPGLFPFSEVSNAEADNLLIKNKDLTMRLKPDGKIEIKNEQSSKEAIEILQRLITTMKDALIVTGIGLQPFGSTTLSKLQTLENDINTLKV